MVTLIYIHDLYPLPEQILFLFHQNMEKLDREKDTKLVHQIIDTIAYRVKSDHVTLFEL